MPVFMQFFKKMLMNKLKANAIGGAIMGGRKGGGFKGALEGAFGMGGGEGGGGEEGPQLEGGLPDEFSAEKGLDEGGIGEDDRLSELMKRLGIGGGGIGKSAGFGGGIGGY